LFINAFLAGDEIVIPNKKGTDVNSFEPVVDIAFRPFKWTGDNFGGWPWLSKKNYYRTG